jgi:hypothetical protein
VLGLAERRLALMIWVRRYLCRGCKTTISVLHEDLYPGRWYLGGAILVSLFLSLLLSWPATKVRDRIGKGKSEDWKTLRRWQRQLLSPMWGFLGKQLGFPSAPVSRDESRLRLIRLLALGAAGPPGTASEVELLAPMLLRDTAHDGVSGWPMRRRR